MSDNTDGLSLLEAAQRLDISERTLRRRIKAGEIRAEKQPLDGGGAAWRVFIEPDKPTGATDNVADTERTRAGTVAENADAVRMQEMREEIIFLRGVIEQQQRAEAELRAALRESLKALPKALNAPERGGHVPDKLDNVPDNVPTVNNATPTPKTDQPATNAPEPQNDAPAATDQEALATQMQTQNGTQTTNASLNLEQVGTQKRESVGANAAKPRPRESTFMARLMRRISGK